MSRRASRRVSRRRRRRSRRKKWPYVVLAVVLILGVGLAASVLLGFNPLLAMQLRSQFGDAFFSDFGNLSPDERGEDLESIVANYEPSFQALEEMALERLDRLFATAIGEYHEKGGGSALDQARLTNKYIQAGRILERSVDETFDELLEEMKFELTSRGYPTDAAEEFKKTYEKAKADKKRELLDRLRRETGDF